MGSPSEQVVVALKITTDAQTGGIKVTTGSLDDLGKSAAHAGNEWEKLGNKVAKKFSAADISKEVLTGLGIGSGMAVAERLAGLMEEHFRAAAEHAQAIAEATERQLENMRELIRLRQTDNQQLETAVKEQKDLQQQLADAQKPKTTQEPILKREAGGGYQFTGFRTVSRERTKEEEADLNSIIDKLQKQDIVVEQLRQKVRAADQERALSLAKGSAELAGTSDKAQRDYTNIAESQAIGAAALQQWNDERRESAKNLRELDPLIKYGEQLKKIDELMVAIDNDGKPFLTTQEGAAVKARILAEMHDTAGKAIRSTREEVEKYDIALEVLDKNPALSDQEKQKQRIQLIDQQTAAIKRAREALQAFIAANPGVDTAALTEALSRLGQQEARNAGLSQPAQTLAQRDRIALADRSDPSKHYQSGGAGALGGAQGFLASLGTIGDNLAEGLNGGLNAALGQTSNLLYNIATRATSFRDAWSMAITGIGQEFARMATDMVAKLIWRSTIERALTAFSVTTHIAGEQAKTAGTAQGVLTRIALTVKEALASVYHGAIEAFKALAGIPIVGPVLGAAALAGALVLGMGLVSKIGGHAAGGIVQGGRQLSWLNEEGQEAVIKAPSLRKFGTSFISSLNDGVLDLGALPASIAGQLPAAADAAAAAQGFGGGSAGSSGGSGPQQNHYWLFDRSQFARMMQEDSRGWFHDMSAEFQRKNS